MSLSPARDRRGRLISNARPGFGQSGCSPRRQRGEPEAKDHRRPSNGPSL
jgi:hypothetical protein